MTDQPSARDVIVQTLFNDGFGGTSDPELTAMFAELCQHNADVVIAALRAVGMWVAPWEPSFEIVSMGGHAIWDHTSAAKHELICNAWAAMRDAYLQSKPGE